MSEKDRHKDRQTDINMHKHALKITDIVMHLFFFADFVWVLRCLWLQCGFPVMTCHKIMCIHGRSHQKNMR